MTCPECGADRLEPRSGEAVGGEPDERWWEEWWQCAGCGRQFDDDELRDHAQREEVCSGE